MRNQSFVIEAEAEEGIVAARAWMERELGMKPDASNPDVVVLRHGLLSVEDARRIFEVASGAPFVGESKALIITASRAYHEAQNALLKLFEEPPPNTYIFFVLPSLGGLLPTLRSRVQVLNVKGFVNPSSDERFTKPFIPKVAEEFLRADKEERSAIIKRLTSGRDDEERRELRDEAIAILNGIEAIAYQRGDSLRGPQGVSSSSTGSVTSLLSDIAVLRGHLYDRSAPVKMILEHLSLVIPKNVL